ncbi:sigma-54 dependent transcriptional regulator [Luminiphilus sp.]|nr:sigma-54 dependent transcriptional regulator [Luminiphilus sp.]MDC3251027.1 sigma-54 dependent transcriptional regulator [Luminiphilus sp.]
MNTSRVLIVEDDPTLRMALVDTLETAGFQVFEAVNGKEALLQLMHHDVEAIVSDVQMDVMDGEELLTQVRNRYPSIPFLMMTAHGSIERAVSAIRDGAVDYLQKPFEAAALVSAVERMTIGSKLDSGVMIAEDPATKSILEVARRVAPSDASIMISGESGTGKEVLAKTIHELSDRSDGPFVALNCAAIPENMLEAILFGYEKGAFTGAQVAREGKFEQANGGTLLLDEISEMALELQSKLLRVLQEQEVERLGGKSVIPLNVRVLATTNRKLTEEVASGRFREDLYFRLNVFPMELPPLRTRREDIIPLSHRFIKAYAAERALDLSTSAEDKLMSHGWRGNIRELGNCIHRACILASGSTITPSDLVFDELTSSSGSTDQPAGDDLKGNERDLILAALRDSNGNRKLASERLGISGRTLRYKLAKYKEDGITIPETVAA